MKLFEMEKMDAVPLQEPWTLDKVPPFPSIALRALNMMTGTESSLPELCDLIRIDPAFSSAVLRMANSPLIGFSRRITSVLEASMLLGFRRLKSLVITIGLQSYLEEMHTPLLQPCWHHSLACAILAEQAATSAGVDKNFAHTAGILHDLGRIAMAASMPGSYARVLEKSAARGEDLLRIERETCGIDHCEVGRRLVEAWYLPPAFSEIISGHHNSQGSYQDVVAIVRSSCRLADSLGFPEHTDCPSHSYAEILDEIPENVRREFPGDARKMAVRIKKEIRMVETA
jgi:putative nucleotidyltransferase with HDIG domain